MFGIIVWAVGACLYSVQCYESGPLPGAGYFHSQGALQPACWDDHFVQLIKSKAKLSKIIKNFFL